MTDYPVSVNLEARKKRHSSINFDEGYLIKKQKFITLSNKRFFSRVLSSVVVFVCFYFVSLHSTYTYNQTPIDLGLEEPVFDTSYLFSDTGFVLKPFLPHETGKRSRLDTVVEYTVEPGDTLSGIALRFGISVRTIIDNNEGVTESGALKVGKKLSILPVNGLLYTPTAQESLEAIAKKFSVSLEALREQNRIEEGVLFVVKELIIPGAVKKWVAPIVQSVTGSSSRYDGGYTGNISGDFIWPANGKITQGYHRYHYALDIAHREKGPIIATANGVVKQASYGWNGGYGNVIIIDHGNGFESLYGHNEKLYVSAGDTVTQGQTIAWMGNSGRVRGITGIHLHFEIIKDGIKRNPRVYIGSQ